MIERFGVIVFSEYLSEKEKEIMIRAFSDFYHDLSPKHQKRVQLNWIKNESNIDSSQELAEKYFIPVTNFQVIDNRDKSILNDTKLCVHPSKKYFNAIIPLALSHGIPIVTIDDYITLDYINQSCGIIIEDNSNEHTVRMITYYLDMLYFDEEVLKVLSKGAFDQYEKKFGWGLKEFRKGRI